MALTVHVFRRTLDGSAPVTEYIPIKGTTTITKGDLCALSSGYLTAASDGGPFPIGVAEATVANAGSSGAAKAPVNVNRNSIYEGTLDVNSAASLYGTACDVDSATVIDASDTSNTKGLPIMLLGPIGTATDLRQEWILNLGGIAAQ